MHIDIHTSHTSQEKCQKRRGLLGVCSAVFLGIVVIRSVHFFTVSTMPLAIGGPDILVSSSETESPQGSIRRLRIQQAVLRRREETLWHELRQADVGQQADARRALVALLQEQAETNEELATFLRQLWQADSDARRVTEHMTSSNQIALSWPVQPTEGVSADFEDPYYAQAFGIPHQAIDIPVLQGTSVQAAADGVVSVVADNGLGYNYLIISHNGYATLYGHVTEFMVTEGQTVKAGEHIAKSGGMPGTPGAGAMTTGAHLHFELLSDEHKIDPMPYLPYSSKVEVVRRWRENLES